MMAQPVPTHVFHMTRIERLPSIIQHGLLPDNEVRSRGLAGVEIGYRQIKDRRVGRAVPCGPGGTLADYVPFYFAPRSPMLYAIQGGLLGPEAAQAECLVHANVPWAALRGLATKSEEVAREVRATLASLGVPTAVSVRRDWYF